MIYLDNASTSYPKPSSVWRAARSYMGGIGVSPSRGTHKRGALASKLVDETRVALSNLFGIANPNYVAFTQNATHSLNIAIKGSLEQGDHVVTTTAEHNSVLRPLEALRRAEVIEYTTVAPSIQGAFDLAEFAAAFKPNTKLVVVNHASNVTGGVAPVEEMFAIAHERGALCLLDASQSAGYLDIDVVKLGVDILAFTGHKWLHGPSGIGGLFVNDPDTVRPLFDGATGQVSHSLRHPMVMPSKFEAGTLNYLGIAGLNSVLQGLSAESMARTRTRVASVQKYFWERIGSLAAVTGYPATSAPFQVPVMSINIAGRFPGEVGSILDDKYSIITRTGLHCAPLIHKTLGTPQGTIRFSLGTKTTKANIDLLADALVESVLPAAL